MPDVRRVPPGRAGRLWLRRRLDTAERGVALLDRKLRILRTEQERRRLLAEQTGVDWRDRCREADRWLARTAMLGGQREIRLGTGPPTAEVTVVWGSVLGARYPMEVTCQPAEPTDRQRAPGTAGLGEAVVAYRAALRAAASHAAASEACRVVEAEVAETRRRVRALTDRWIPRLAAAAAELDQRLEEAERAEQIRMRWAVARQRRQAVPARRSRP